MPLLLDDLDAGGVGVTNDVLEAELLPIGRHSLKNDHRDLAVLAVQSPMHDDAGRTKDGLAHQHTPHKAVGCSLTHDIQRK